MRIDDHYVCGQESRLVASRPGQGKVLQLRNFGKDEGEAVELGDYRGDLDRLWRAFRQEDGRYGFENMAVAGRHHLFSYFEYTGRDFARDAAKMAADPVPQKWWSVCKPCQIPLRDRAKGEWWSDMEERKSMHDESV